jgi:hypothetical protein
MSNAIKIKICCHGPGRPVSFEAAEGDTVLIRQGDSIAEAVIKRIISRDKILVSVTSVSSPIDLSIPQESIVAILLSD